MNQPLGQRNAANSIPVVLASDSPILPSTIFGEVQIASPYPIAQLDFVYGINTNLVTTATTGSGTVTSANQLGVARTTAATASSAKILSKRRCKYRPGQGTEARFTAMFTTPAANSTQLAGVCNGAVDAYAIGYNGTALGILIRRNSVDTYIAQASWNKDKLDGSGLSKQTIDPTKLNIFRIQWGHLGTRGFLLSWLSPVTGNFIAVHDYSPANTLTAPTVINPTMQLFWEATNTTNNTNIAVSGASGAMFIQGDRRRLGGTYGTSNFKSIATADTNILTVRNNTTINSTTNNSTLRVRSVSFATAAAVPVTCKLIKNATLGGTPAYTNIDAVNSLASFDIAGTTITGGIVVFNTAIGSTNSNLIDLTDFDIYLDPGETLTISMAAISGGASNQLATINWNEDV